MPRAKVQSTVETAASPEEHPDEPPEPPGGPHPAFVGRTLVVVGGGGYSKRFVFERFRSWGLRTVLLDQDALHPACALVDLALHVPEMADHGDERRAEAAALDALGRAGVRPDAVLTFWEDNGPLCARLNSRLGLRGSDPTGAATAKSKWATQRALASSAETAELAVRSVRCERIDDLDDALGRVPLPALLKLEHGCGALGVEAVADEQSCRAALLRWWSLLPDEQEYPGAGLSFGRAFVLTERAIGSEHDVDIVMNRGVVHCAFVTDNSPTREPTFLETAAIMPSLLSARGQSELVDAAARTCLRLGLRDGVYNVEMIRTKDGVRIVDVNARMGGFYIRAWILRLWRYDLLEAAVAIGLGLEPPPLRQPRADGFIVGAMLLGSLHGEPLLAAGGWPALDPGAEDTRWLNTRFSEDVLVRPVLDEAFANVAAHASTPRGACEYLSHKWKALGLDVSTPPLVRYLRSFVPDLPSC